ncbi:MAG: hypothetical protein ACOX3B_03245 [Bacilli bacterium]|jgi:hypothetical protein|nr:hypothetical protein [Bacillota bacterium]NLI51915.1 hypothetical protein [Erysipelotrichaceae bacterium]HOA11119.1 hypothetical protein [Bacilli bacterium]HOE54407.1 hypothetical protein [Bacilli bacterium]HOH95510.1 hypothetical protein [Bacilli bacterium]
MTNTNIKLITEKTKHELFILKIDVILVRHGLKRTQIVYDRAGQVAVSFVPPKRK